jgi:hypothetical protein
MSASNIVVIYDIATMAVTPSQSLRRVVICDNDAQVSAADGPCKLNAGEAKLLIPKATYQSFSNAADIVNFALAQVGL